MNLRDFLTSSQFLLPMAFILGGFALGLIVERATRSLLRRGYKRNNWEGLLTVSNGLRGMIALWFTIAGLYIAIRVISLSPGIQTVYRQAFMVLLIFTMTLVVARISAGLVDLYIRRAEGSLPSTTILGNILRILILLTGLLVILTYLEVPIAPLITALGVGGFAMALAFQDTLSNLFSGLHILASKLITPGDYMKMDSGDEGYVVDVNWRNTTVKTLPGNMVVIPNSKLASAVVTNYNQPVKEMNVLMDIGISYSSDLERVEEVTLEVARETLLGIPGGISTFEPFIRYKSFSDYRIDFTIIMRVEQFVDQYLLKHEFIKRLHRRYREEDIEIPFPIEKVIVEREREEAFFGS